MPPWVTEELWTRCGARCRNGFGMLRTYARAAARQGVVDPLQVLRQKIPINRKTVVCLPKLIGHALNCVWYVVNQGKAEQPDDLPQRVDIRP